MAGAYAGWLKIKGEKMITSNEFINLPGVTESATGCRGASSYRSFAESKGYKYIEVLNWCSSAGDWQFIISKDNKEWQILEQTNNYPCPGFSHRIDEKIWLGTTEEVLAEFAKGF